uniref:Interleukin 15 receptor, alpha chain n=2 Tax=Nannospalax galili TaxID=1026970 RepID=A0A8C6QYU4_NANGA
VASETALVPGSQLAPSQPPSAGTTGTGSHESSQAPSPTTAKTLEPSSSTSLRTPGVSPHSSKTIA